MNKVLLTCTPLLVCNSLAACFYDYISHGFLRAYVIFAVLVVVLVTRDSHFDEESDRTKQKEYVKGELTSLQVEPLARRRWKDVLVWITFSREEILWKDSKQQTILHHAVLFQAPVEIINMILLEAPELATMANKDGELPLHWAVRLSLSNQVLRALLVACPTAGVYARDDKGNTPLSLLWDRHQDSLLRLWWTNKQFVLRSPSWQRIMLLMRFSYFRTTDCPIACDPGALDLHIAASCPCPPAMFPLVLRVYHDHLDEQSGRARLRG